MMHRLMILALFAAALGHPSGAADTPTAPQFGEAARIVIQNYYYALPGKAEEVYRWRLQASEVRAALGLRAGRVLQTLSGQGEGDAPADLPDVVWECDYPSPEARAAESAILEANEAWKAVEAHMSGLLAGFRRVTFQGAPMAAP